MSHRHITQALKSIPAKSSAAVKKFLNDFYEKISTEDIDLMEPHHMASLAMLHWDLSAQRRPGRPIIKIRTTRIKKGDSDAGYTLIDMVNDDRAFLVDSIAAEIARQGRLIHLLIHPVMHIERGGGRKQVAITGSQGAKTQAQSHIHIQLQGAMAESAIPDLEQALIRVLDDVMFSTRDWQDMKEKLRECEKILTTAPKNYNRRDIDEYIGFLEYLYKDNFTLLGYREYRFTESDGNIKSHIVNGSSLGLLHEDAGGAFISDSKDGLPQDLQRMRRELPPLTVMKLARRSTVHRSVPLDAIVVKKHDRKGSVVGECLFIGLFTSVTYSRSIQDVPLLRRKADEVLAKSGFRIGGHNYKAARHILEKYPRDELFQMSMDKILKTVTSIMHLQERQRIALYTRRDIFGRYVSCLVYVPRDRYDTRLRMIMQQILESEIGGRCSDFYTNLDDSNTARVMFTVETNEMMTKTRYDTKKIEARLQEAGRVWSEKLALALLDVGGDESRIPDIVEKYGNAFPVGYQENYEPRQCVYDIGKLGEAEKRDNSNLTLDLYRCKVCGGDALRLKVYARNAPINLSDILPILENMGLTVLSELPFEVKPKNADESIWIQDFLMQSKDRGSLTDIENSKPKFEEALGRIWRGEMENDSLNHLVLRAHMDWRDIMILRAYVRYMRQAGTSFSTRFIERTLYSQAEISGLAIELFKCIHNPRKKSANAKKLKTAIETALDKVVSLEEDRILRTIINLIESTLRTNFFQSGADGALKPYLSLKLDSRAVNELPSPRPFREIFVYSPRVEGIHLRGDMIARGGIRWSDRHEDFRTEVLGLMKAQQVKNSLIVPMGAKGGFVVKKPPAGGDRKAYLAEGIECYKILVRGLLDLTDNRKGKKVIPPRQVIRLDGDDPYLVVAADKGTASFSDIANSLSAEYGFWLGDAFASGGSAGYDHKKMGITARGAWESVKRHFRELNHDTQKQPFDVIGVGDMGGDVFGNGMLLSEKTRLVGAFNHIHIFCDPDPDMAASFKERKRLFDAVKGWDEYDTKKLSKGGRIYSRADKSLQLTPEIMRRFDIGKEKVTPADLIQAILRARADLLYFGGIGTYVKASHETHADAGDKTNDALRIDANELRAKIIGEGANLAITQAARVEFALCGGKLNADFVDNSGGVNSSDVEVNIKILMSVVMENPKRKMTTAARNKLLSSMTEEVAQVVLTNNYQQAQALSLMEMHAGKNLSGHTRFINDLEKSHGLSRRLEGLPDEDEIEERRRAGKGLTRPELAVLQAHAKILFTKDLLASNLPEQKDLEPHWLFNYFPAPLREKYTAEMRNHRLRREIVATTLACGIVNRMGPTFVKETMDRTGASCAEVVKAFLIVRDAFDLRALWFAIEDLDGRVPAAVQLRAMQDVADTAWRETLWFLTRLNRPLDIKRDTADFHARVDTLRSCLDKVMADERRASMNQRLHAGMENGLPKDLAWNIAIMPVMGAAGDIIRISMD
ncbi:MAG: NAD-glutamate dehydrogenase, partial [Proteobacteria bacterium]|nr:NAD-glutamate dehydrogenase [Pseudomonadota bacterium]